MKKVFLVLAIIIAVTVTSCKQATVNDQITDSVTAVDSTKVDSTQVDSVKVDTTQVK